MIGRYISGTKQMVEDLPGLGISGNPVQRGNHVGEGNLFLSLLERVFFGLLLTVLNEGSSECLKTSLPGFLVGWVVGLTGGTLGLMTPQGVTRPRVPRAAPAAGSWGGLKVVLASFLSNPSVCSMRLDTESSLPGINI